MPTLTLDANTDSLDVMERKLVELGTKLSLLRFVKNKATLYTDAQCINLQGDIAKLIQALKDVEETEDNITIDKKRIIGATFAALCVPNDDNCNKLRKIAGEVQGHGNKWMKVGLILSGIALFMCGILPGIIFAAACMRTSLWSQYNDKGLAKAANDIAKAIDETEAFLDEPYKGRFFYFRPLAAPSANSGKEHARDPAVVPSAPPKL
jgi:hypothetical protein